MQEQHHRPGTGFDDVEAASVGAHEPVIPRSVEEDGGFVRRGAHGDQPRVVTMVACAANREFRVVSGRMPEMIVVVYCA